MAYAQCPRRAPPDVFGANQFLCFSSIEQPPPQFSHTSAAFMGRNKKGEKFSASEIDYGKRGIIYLPIINTPTDGVGVRAASCVWVLCLSKLLTL